MTRRVDPSVYTEDYYLKACSGYGEFKKSWGESLEPRLLKAVKEIDIQKDMKILDIGAGRGEMIFWAAAKGAKATGIDYSRAAVSLARKARSKKSKRIQSNTSFKLMDAKKLEFKDKSFDGIFLIEVLEHLYPEEQQRVFTEVARVLKKGGFVFVHTAPSKWFNDITYRLWSYPLSSVLVTISNRILGNKYGNISPWKKLRTRQHVAMHVNEPNYFALKKLFQEAGFAGKIRSTNITVVKPSLSWKDKLFNAIVYLYPASNYFPLNVFWGNDFWTILKKK